MSAPVRCASRAISHCAAASWICGPPGSEQPLRLDFFGDRLDAIRRFDAETQLSAGEIAEVELLPRQRSAGWTALRSVASHGLCRGIRAANDDPLYESVSAARKALGMEHWLPLFYAKLETLSIFFHARSS